MYEHIKYYRLEYIVTFFLMISTALSMLDVCPNIVVAVNIIGALYIIFRFDRLMKLLNKPKN